MFKRQIPAQSPDAKKLRKTHLSDNDEVFGTITVIDCDGEDRPFPLSSTQCLLGSGDDCDIIVRKPGVARKTCRVDINQDRQAFLVKLCETTPIFLNGVETGSTSLLRNNDVITLAGRRFRYDTHPPAINHPRRKRMKPKDIAAQYIKAQQDQPGLHSKFIDREIGRGVFASREYDQGDFLLEYSGELLSLSDAMTVSDTNFTFHFNHSGKKYCIDATQEPKHGPSLGRLVNHGDKRRDRNAVMKTVTVENVPHLCLFSSKNISVGEQILYDYGTKDLPWLQAKKRKSDAVPAATHIELTPKAEVKESKSELMESHPEAEADGDVQESVSAPVESHAEVESDGDVQESKSELMESHPEAEADGDVQESVSAPVESHAEVESDGDVQESKSELMESHPEAEADGDVQESVSAPVESHAEIESDGDVQESKSELMESHPEAEADGDVQESVSAPVESHAEIESDGDVQESKSELMKSHPEAEADGDVQELESTLVKLHPEVESDGDVQKSIAALVESHPEAKADGDLQTLMRCSTCSSFHRGNICTNTTECAQHKGFIVNDCPTCQSCLETHLTRIKHQESVSAPVESHPEVESDGDVQESISAPVESHPEAESDGDVQWRHGVVDQTGVFTYRPDNRGARQLRRHKADLHYTEEIDSDHMVYTDDDDNDPDYQEEKDKDIGSDDTDHGRKLTDYDSGEYVNGSSSNDSEYYNIIPLSMTKSVVKHKGRRNNNCQDKKPHKNRDHDAVSRCTYDGEIVGERKKSQKNNEHHDTEHEDNDDIEIVRKVTDEGNKTSNTESVVVRSTTAYIDGHRVTDKQHSCVLCGKLYHRIARHLQTVHKDDTAVTAVTSRTKNEKRKGLDKLRLEGDYRHNINVLTNNDGNLIVARRPSTNSAETYSYSEYLPCEYCKGFYLRNDLWRHRAKCEFAPTMATTEDQSRPKERVQRNSVLLLQSSLPDNKDLHKGFMSNVISTLSCDGTTLIVRNDNLILKVGENLYMKHGRDQKQYISQEVRLLGRLVQSLRKIGVNKNGYLTDYLKPSMFDTIVEAAQELAGVQESDDKFSFNTPSVALKLGPVLKKCCVVLKGHALRNSDEIGERDAERLQKLIEEEWKTKVTSVALRSIKEKKRNTQILLPTASDLMKFKIYVDAQLTEAQQRLIKEETMDTYQRLSTVVICKIITFNRRRSGEVSKMLLDDFVNRPDWQSNLNEEIVQSLAELEKKLVQRLDMIAIRGKRGRTVSVILTPETSSALQLLIKLRLNVKINISNTYLFPRASGTGHIEGHRCIRTIVDEIDGLEHPERIGSTNLRKYIATVIQMLNLNPGELEWLSNHLGHTIDVHKEFYRNQESAVTLGKVAKMLLAVESGHTLKPGAFEDGDSLGVALDSASEDEADIPELPVPQHNIIETTSQQTVSAQENSTKDNLKPASRTVTAKALKRVVKVPWTGSELAALKRQFGKHYRLMMVPNKADCMRAKDKETALKDRDWKTIKFRVHHDIRKLRHGQS